MKVTTLAALALLATSSTLTLAQTAPSNTAPSTTAARSANLQQQVATNLQQSGFTHVKVMPDSFLVQANDKTGNPVTMFITPNSMTEITDVGMTSGNSGGNNASMFVTVPPKADLSSKVVGTEVYNNDNKSIGSIKDIAYNDNGRVNGYILSVGGFLGIGDHYVAVRPSAVNLSWNASTKKWNAKMNATADQLKSAPEYKYAS